MKQPKVSSLTVENELNEQNAEELTKLRDMQFKKYLENQRQRKQRQNQIRREMELQKEPHCLDDTLYVWERFEANLNVNQCSPEYMRYCQKLKILEQIRQKQMQAKIVQQKQEMKQYMDNYFENQRRRKKYWQMYQENCKKNSERYLMERQCKRNHNHDRVDNCRQLVLDERRKKAMVWNRKMMERHEKKKEKMKELANTQKEMQKEVERKIQVEIQQEAPKQEKSIIIPTASATSTQTQESDAIINTHQLLIIEKERISVKIQENLLGKQTKDINTIDGSSLKKESKNRDDRLPKKKEMNNSMKQNQYLI